MNSRPMLEFQVLPSWHLRVLLESVLVSFEMQPELEEEQIISNEQQLLCCQILHNIK